MKSVRLTPVKPSAKRRILILLTYIVSVACLLWVLQHINWPRFLGELRSMNWWWVSLAVAADIAVYVWQGWRWGLMLKPIANVPILRTIRAIYVGLFANEVLPLRTGEVIRCYLQARWNELPFSVVLSSVVIERIFDGFFLVIAVFITASWVPSLPRYIVDLTIVLALIVGAGAVLVGIAMFHKQRAHAVLSSEKKWHRQLRILIEDLHLIGHSRHLYYSWLLTIPFLLTQIVPFYAMMKAYNFRDPSWGVATVLMVVLRLGSAVPQAPGNIGVFQALAVVVLSGVFKYDNSLATGFSLATWAVITLPLLVVGFFALAITGAKIGELRHKANSAMPEVKPPVEAAPDSRI